MSWSKSASGNQDEVADKLSTWLDEQAKADKASSLNEAATEGHAEQIALVRDTVVGFISDVPDGAQFSVSGYGHHSGIGTDRGNAGLSVSYSFPPTTK